MRLTKVRVVGSENLVPLGPHVERRPVLSRIIDLHLLP